MLEMIYWYPVTWALHFDTYMPRLLMLEERIRRLVAAKQQKCQGSHEIMCLKGSLSDLRHCRVPKAHFLWAEHLRA